MRCLTAQAAESLPSAPRACAICARAPRYGAHPKFAAHPTGEPTGAYSRVCAYGGEATRDNVVGGAGPVPNQMSVCPRRGRPANRGLEAGATAFPCGFVSSRLINTKPSPPVPRVLRGQIAPDRDGDRSRLPGEIASLLRVLRAGSAEVPIEASPFGSGANRAPGAPYIFRSLVRRTGLL